MIDVILALKFVHVLFAAVMFGAWLAAACFMVFARRSGNASVVALVSLFVVRIELFVVAPAMVLQPVTGVPLETVIGLSNIDNFWIDSSILVYAIVVLAWLGALRAEFVIRRMARQASLGGTKLGKNYARVFRIWSGLAVLIFAGLVLLYLLMIWQPRLS
jgi:uncharacterized membrane protein